MNGRNTATASTTSDKIASVAAFWFDRRVAKGPRTRARQCGHRKLLVASLGNVNRPPHEPHARELLVADDSDKLRCPRTARALTSNHIQAALRRPRQSNRPRELEYPRQGAFRGRNIHAL